MEEVERKKTDDNLRAEMLADTVGDPPLEVQIILLGQQLQIWTNSYFASRSNLRVAYEAGLVQLRDQYFDEAKRFRVGVQRISAEIEGLEQRIEKEKGNGRIAELAASLAKDAG